MTVLPNPGAGPVRRQADSSLHRVSSLFFDSGLVHQHHRDIVPDWIHAPAFHAFQAASIRFQVQSGLAHRADQDFQQFFADGHREYYSLASGQAGVGQYVPTQRRGGPGRTRKNQKSPRCLCVLRVSALQIALSTVTPRPLSFRSAPWPRRPDTCVRDLRSRQSGLRPPSCRPPTRRPPRRRTRPLSGSRRSCPG